jgi:uncharacterized oxidoreductase
MSAGVSSSRSAFIEHLQTRPDATIITVSSGLAFAPLRVTPSYNASKGAIHMLSESIRLQLADTTVKVIELVTPAVRTALLPGQEESPMAMPLDEFVAQIVALLDEQPDAKEIQVERVKFLRYGEARGDYDQVIAALNGSDPHAKLSPGRPPLSLTHDNDTSHRGEHGLGRDRPHRQPS